MQTERVLSPVLNRTPTQVKQSIQKLVKDIESYLESRDYAENDSAVQMLIIEQANLEKELQKHRRTTKQFSPRSQPRQEDELKSVLKASYQETELEVFVCPDESYKAIFKPSLALRTFSQEFYLIFKTAEKVLPEIVSTNLPCFIQHSFREPTAPTEYILDVAKRLESYLLRKNFIELTEEKFSEMLKGSVEHSFPCDFVSFAINVESQRLNISSLVKFRLLYEIDAVCAKEVNIAFEGTHELDTSVKNDIVKESAAFKSNNLYDAFCQIFE